MANLLDQIGQRNVVRVISNGLPASFGNLNDVDNIGIGTGEVPIWNGDQFTPIVEGSQISKSTIVLTVNPDTSRTAWTDTIDAGFF